MMNRIWAKELDGALVRAERLRGTGVAAIDCSLARSRRQIGLFRGLGFCLFRGWVHARPAVGIP